LQFEGSPDKWFSRPYLKNTQHKTGLVDGGVAQVVEALSSNPSIAKRKKVS
jgi:hypothetical protein